MAFRSVSTSGTGASQQPFIKGIDHSSMLALSDENSMMKQIQATHAPDGREVDVRPLLNIVQDILNRAHVDSIFKLTENKARTEMEEKNYQSVAARSAMLEALAFVIDRIACELSYKALSGSDAHATTIALFNMLSSYSWDAKLVLTMAAFALNYGEFFLLAQLYSTNPLAKSMAMLRQLPEILEHTAPLKPRFDALHKLIRVMMQVTNCIVEFRELPSSYISPEVSALSTAISHVPTAVYWTIRSVVVCATQITSLTSIGPEFATSESWELSTLAHKLENIYDHLRKQLSICYEHIEGKRNAEAYEMLHKLFEMVHIDNMKILKALIYAKDDIPPLFDGSTKRRVNLDVLRGKSVLLLISGLDISHDELAILEQIYNESRIHATRLENRYEVIWIPIVDQKIPWNDMKQKQFESLQSTMPWYTVHHPSIVEKVVVKFIKDVWHFRNKPILVVLDPTGKVLSPNAIHMMWIWGSNAFPFTSFREEALWREETWRLEVLVDGIDPTILNWIKEGKYIFLYGGDDVEWIRKFTNTARSVAQSARIPLEMVYVGKSSKRDKIQRIIATINVEKLSYVWQDMTMIWFFWTRLESMLFSKIQLGKIDEHDPMMQEIKRLLSHDKEGGWAVLSKGSNILVNGHSTTILPTLLEYDIWKENVPIKGFDMSFKDHHDKLHGVSHPCSRFEFPSSTGRIPENLKCPECQRNMQKYISFLCCHEEDFSEGLY